MNPNDPKEREQVKEMLDKTEVVDMRKADTATVVICGLVVEGQPPHVPEAIRQRCSECDALVWFTPTSSPNSPAKLCWPCAQKQIAERKAKDGESPEFFVSERTVAETLRVFLEEEFKKLEQ